MIYHSKAIQKLDALRIAYANSGHDGMVKTDYCQTISKAYENSKIEHE
jgi:hypothetical protein